ncbi:hypothetical protein PYV50_01880 [Pseudomonas sp. H22_DOA]|nr:hypothetical protein PYV50_01880 [Pseudomonas sp. H22_DOA]
MFDPGSKKIASAWEHLKDYKALHKKLIETGEIDEKKLKGVQINILALKDLMSPYINAIVELAECGVAVPEFALSPDDQYAGTEDFQAFIELTNKRDELEKKSKRVIPNGSRLPVASQRHPECSLSACKSSGMT